MRYRPLGGTGIQVSVHCLGAMMFGAVGNPDHDDCVRIVHAALDQGINFVDTADMYSAGESEQIVGQALRGRRDDVVLATKVHFPMGEGPNRSGNSRRWVLKAVRDSLQRLRTDWIDLYQVHGDLIYRRNARGLRDLRRSDESGCDRRVVAAGRSPNRGRPRPLGSRTRGLPSIHARTWAAPTPRTVSPLRTPQLVAGSSRLRYALPLVPCT